MNYYIQGNKDRAEEIKAAFETKGFKLRSPLSKCDQSDMIYFSIDGEVRVINARNLDLFKTHPDYKELELPKPHYDIANFYAGMPVLVRDNVQSEWCYISFSHYAKNLIVGDFCAGGVHWNQCIPFEGNEHLIGTTEPCDVQYINW